MDTAIKFKRLAKDHFPLLVNWLNQPHIAEFYATNGPYDLEFVEKKYSKLLTPTNSTKAYITFYNNTPIGYIQTYAIREWTQYAEAIGLDEDAAGLDLFIGSPDHVHRGIGSRIIRACLQQIVFQDGSFESCWIGPEADNIGAIRAYEKAGFRHLKTIHNTVDQWEEYIMRISRDDI